MQTRNCIRRFLVASSQQGCSEMRISMDYRNDGKLEFLQKRVQELLLQSEDAEFTEYLKNLQTRLSNQRYQLDLLEGELERATAMKETRMCLKREQTTQVQTTQDQMTQMQSETFIPAAQPAVQPVPGKGMSAEFAVGAVLLSILGGGLILAAFIMLGMYYLEGLFKGIALFAVSGAVIAVSEAFLYKRWERLGKVFTSIGIGGLYASTAVNFLALKSFNVWVTLGLVVLILLFSLFLSKKRGVLTYRVIGLTACYLCFIPMGQKMPDYQFLILTGILTVINMVCAFTTPRVEKINFRVIHLAVGTVFAQVMLFRQMQGGTSTAVQLLWILETVAVAQVLLVRELLSTSEKTECVRSHTGMLVTYGITAFLNCIMICEIFASADEEIMLHHICMLALLIICGVAFAIVKNDRERWAIYYFINCAILMLYESYPFDWGITICILAELVLSKVLTLQKEPCLKTSECILSILAGAACLSRNGTVQGVVLLAGMILSIAAISYWQTFYEILSVATVCAYAALTLPEIVKLPAIAGICFGAVILFYNVKRWRGRQILLLNWFCYVVQILCFLMLLRSVYATAYVTWGCMLVFGSATIVLTIQETYGMKQRYRSLVFAVFLTYMFLVIRIPMLPFLKSVLLMIVALACVGIGFADDQKNVRIYGLLLSMLVCGKIVLYDFVGAQSLQKILLFFGVGMLALVIAGIYIVLEKKKSDGYVEGREE